MAIRRLRDFVQDFTAFVERSGGDEERVFTEGRALLASCSIVSLGAAFYAFRENRERAFALICVVQILVLVLAASGIMGSG